MKTKTKLRIAQCIACVLFCSVTFAQKIDSKTKKVDMSKICLPKMYGKKDSGLAIEHNFNHKHHILSIAGINDSSYLFIPLDSLRIMINEFKQHPEYPLVFAHLALNDEDPNNKKLTLVFVPGLQNPSGNYSEDLNYAYELADNGNLRKKSYSQWIVNYTANVLSILQPSVTVSVNSPTDTKSICYFKDSLNELITEMDNLRTNRINASGLQVIFAAYSSNHPSYPNRLLVVYEFTKLVRNHNQIFYLENTPRFKKRRKLDCYVYDYLDNGNLCPPTNCPPPPPPPPPPSTMK